MGAQMSFATPVKTDLSPFEKLGGKALFFVGVGDPCCSNVANENFFKDVIKAMGATRVATFATLYQIPGWGHCGGGTGPTDGQDTMLEALVDWVEKGKTPHAIEMHRGADRARLLFASAGATSSGVPVPQPTGPSRDFLVCPFPYVSVFDSSKATVPGAVYEAEHWSCQRPR